MPYPFALPTTSASALTDFFASPSHPSLIFTATSRRALVRDVLKKHKRLASRQVSDLSTVQDALVSYIPFLHTISAAPPAGFGASNYGGITLPTISELKDFSVEWRSTLSSSIPGRDPPRVKIRFIRHELAYVLQTLAYTYTHLARSSLFQLSRTTSPSNEVRTNAITAAMRHLLEAHAIHAYVATSHGADEHHQSVPIDIAPSTAAALASLTLAEATLVVVSKDDPYAAAVAEDRNKDSKEWMIAAPSIPKVRAHLFARICIAAADHAANAVSLLPAKSGGIAAASGKTNEDLLDFAIDLRRTARAKAVRFLGIDAEASARTGEAIAWLRAAKRELGIVVEAVGGGSGGGGGKRSGLQRLKQNWSERREDRRVDKGSDDWGLDAGRHEEIRVVEWLEAKWVKSNDTINVQAVPPFEPLLATLPSGREYHTPKTYTPTALDASTLASMKAPVDPADHASIGNEDDSGDEPRASEPVGAFPGTGGHYAGGRGSYY